MFNSQLFGQHIAHEIIMSALRGHLWNNNPRKALVLSLHGVPGSGKNYVTHMIAMAFYKNHHKSKYFHFFNGRSDFPQHQNINEYKVKIQDTITNALRECEKSIFVFDEVDKMPEGLLNVLVPFLEYHSHVMGGKVSTNHAIFIFLSNTGSRQIVMRLLELWEQGKKRIETTLLDFERVIAMGAFNEKGGFHKSDTIEASLIDHYVPFLPMEEQHVMMCVKAAFTERNLQPTKEMMEESMTLVTYGPPPHFLYSNTGCKRLDQKVAAIAYRSDLKS
ncbi:torsin-like protein isoform X2 [Orussus abietinus]|nr:torsin-like protein isoform X2 [Orussus abietinus]